MGKCKICGKEGSTSPAGTTDVFCNPCLDELECSSRTCGECGVQETPRLVLANPEGYNGDDICPACWTKIAFKLFSSKMTDARMGEIAVMLIKRQLIKEGMRAESFNRDLRNLSRDCGVHPDELRAFFTKLLPELIAKILGVTKVSIIASN